MSKECIHCYSEIHIDAVKCSECEGFQDWRKHIHLSNSVLSLLIALISVLTVAMTVTTHLTADQEAELSYNIPDTPEIIAHVNDYDSGTESFSVINYYVSIPIILINKGNRPGFLYQVEVNTSLASGVKTLLTNKIPIKYPLNQL